jgi:hypothetical protein
VTFDHQKYTKCNSCHSRPSGHPRGQCSNCHRSDTWKIPTPTPAPTLPPTATPTVDPSLPTATPPPVPTATNTPVPTDTPMPTDTPPFSHDGLTDCVSCHSPPANHYGDDCASCHSTGSWD